jgi:hypothetical protein
VQECGGKSVKFKAQKKERKSASAMGSVRERESATVKTKKKRVPSSRPFESSSELMKRVENS